MYMSMLIAFTSKSVEGNSLQVSSHQGSLMQLRTVKETDVLNVQKKSAEVAIICIVYLRCQLDRSQQ